MRQEAVDTLTQAGHSCVPFQHPTDSWLNFGLLWAINGADGYQSFIEALEGEPLIGADTLVHPAMPLPDFKSMDYRRLPYF